MGATTLKPIASIFRAKETQWFQSRGDARLNIHRRHSAGRTSKRPPVRIYVRAHNRPSYPVENYKRSLVILEASRADECLAGDSLYIILSRSVFFFFFFVRRTRARVRRITDRDYREFLSHSCPVSEIYL